ncbi:MFS transporter [Enterocloster sp. OA13]|uniref:MFS transporter n=1 Tax=Enterocloster sp. OA13 TaxID=2914161 RepID=UPI0004710AB1|nr:MFS transporter [Enterocloster sp. OA13]
MPLSSNYNCTLKASYTGYVVQAIVNNFAPLLFLTFQGVFGISLGRITLLVTVNFGIQLLVDLLSARFVDRIGYRTCIVAAHIFAAAGLAGLAFIPDLVPGHFAGLVVCVCLYAIGGGIIEVLISPIVEACPTGKKDAAMSLLHSFYCWGAVAVVLGSTLFFTVAGVGNWRILALLWALVPAVNALVFARVPILSLVEDGDGMGIRELAGNRVFWLFAFIFVCAGASEQAMSQWASAFAESGLKVSKTMGDLAGPCMFSVLMGLSRALYAKYSEKIQLPVFMTISALLCVFSYLLAAYGPDPALALLGCSLCGLSVGILWPGAFSLASASCPRGGTAMFALLALAGDLGCSAGPTLVGLVSGAAEGGMKSGLAVAAWIPAVLVLGLLRVMRGGRKKEYNQ